MSWSPFARDAVISCFVLGLVGVALAVYWLKQWQVRANRPEVDFVLIGKFLVVVAGLVGSALSAVLYVASACWSLLYKVRAAPRSGERNTHHTHPFNGPLSRTTRVSRYQKGKTNLDFTRARDSEWQWHQLGYMQVCSSLQTDNHANSSPLSFYGPDALSAAQPTASKH